jgi:phage shock protein A
MTTELSDWLSELGESAPATAAEVGAALVAVLQVADLAALAIIGAPAVPQLPDPREAVDRTYQQLLEDLQRVRRSVADVASTRHRAGLRLGLVRDSDVAATDIAEAELADARRREEQLTERSQQLQDRVDAYRSARESAKALYTATEAQLRVTEALQADAGNDDAELAKLRDELRASAGRLLKLAGQTASSQDGAEPAPGLLELRADPLGSDIRVLVAVEPADTVTVLAVLDGPEAVSAHGADALKLASDLLTEIRDDGWPADLDELRLAGPDEFLGTFFPADDGSIAARAAVLAGAVPLGQLREAQQLTLEELASRTGLDSDRIAEIELEGLRTAEIHEAVALARALSARLELPAGSGPVLAG